MRFRPSLHNPALLAKSILGAVESLRGGFDYPKEELLVLNYHSTPIKFIPDFRKQLEWLNKHFRLIKANELDEYYSGGWQSDRCSVLITFDDGLRNNLYAASVLQELGITAYFFLIPAFIKTPIDQQKNYYLQHIRPQVNSRIDSLPEDLTSMRADEVHSLLDAGHRIGSHTFSHTLIASASTSENSLHEIEDSKKFLENTFATPVDAFCSINDTLVSVGAREKNLIAEKYRYHFTTLPGYNAQPRNPLFIRRRNVESHWPDGAFRYALGKSDLPRWAKREEAYSAR